MNLRITFYRHPFAIMVSAVCLFALLVTALYFFGLVPGVRKTGPRSAKLLVITGVLLVAAAASWIAALSLSSGGQ